MLLLQRGRYAGSESMRSVYAAKRAAQERADARYAQEALYDAIIVLYTVCRFRCPATTSSSFMRYEPAMRAPARLSRYALVSLCSPSLFAYAATTRYCSHFSFILLHLLTGHFSSMFDMVVAANAVWRCFMLCCH